MSALTVDLPEELQIKAREVAAARQLSLDEVIAVALSQTLSRLVPGPYLEERAARATGAGLKAFLDQVPEATPAEGDALS